ncbi:hypothetical protein T265_07566 [Opisthorchis viverrini]|uniref:Uncharacterized protein n=1 Tax=Opisthorchis viverrini TaxID=6198 RepID=A0A074ZNB8_OPIVI|nr:hypothetical protein T265_07566 [Opisthorchis viverrini]KER24835.1 hypothetical protein T265_07566 [Opisthorchis viverrini]
MCFLPNCIYHTLSLPDALVTCGITPNQCAIFGMVNRKKIQLSFFMRDEVEPRNRSGVNALQYDVHNDRLFTAGRDSVIRIWNAQKPKDSLMQCMEHHADWVNDIVLCCDGKNLEPRNRSGVNALQYDVHNDRLFTAGRDSVIRIWNAQKPKDSLMQCMEHHADWVNDIVLCCDGKNLISASNDTTVKVWNATKGFCMSTLRTHKDYVRVLAYAQHREEVASAGLDHAIFLWDVRTLTALTPTNNTVTTSSFTDKKESIYSLAMNPSGTVLVSGSPDKLIRVWDPRACHKLFQLRGHAGNVRALIVRPDGQEVISASSDGTIRIWSLGMQCCTDTIRVHSQGVFTIQVNEALCSAGTDRNIWATDLSNPNRSVLLGEESDPVLRLLLVETPSKSCLWTSTCNSNVNRWPISPSGMTQRGSVESRSFSSNYDPRESNPPGPALSTSNPSVREPIHQHALRGPSTDTSHLHKMEMLKPDLTIHGGTSVIQYHVCSEKRFVLTKDTDANVAARLVEKLGVVDFENEIKKREKFIYVPNWFTVDLKCGMPIIHLDETDGLSANITLADACLLDEFEQCDASDSPSPDTKVNYGVLLLRSLFARWPKANAFANLENARHDPLTYKVLGVPDHTPVILSEGTGRALIRFLVRDAAPLNEQLMICDSVPDWIRDIVVDRRMPKSTRIEFFLLPGVREYNEKGQCKIVPLVSMKRDCLSASDILLIRKVMDYVYQRLVKLAEAWTDTNAATTGTNAMPSPSSGRNAGTLSSYASGDRFGQASSVSSRHMLVNHMLHLFMPPGMQAGDSRAATRSPASAYSPTGSSADPRVPPMAPLDLPPETFHADLAVIAEVAASSNPNPEDIVEIWCGDQYLDPNMNLRSARHFCWKQSGYLQLTYMVRHEKLSS